MPERPTRTRSPDKGSRSSSRFLARVLKGARPSPLPGFVEPCVPTLRSAPPRGDRWVHEIKYDGYRLQAQVDGGRVTLFTRNGYDWTRRLGRIASAVARLPVNKLILDGEAIVQDSRGASDFGALERDLDSGRQDRFVYIVFDLLHLDGFDVREAPLVERKRVLGSLLAESPQAPIAVSEHLAVDGEEMFGRVQDMGLEGIVSKRADAPYRSGRVQTWLKVKAARRDAFAVIGFTTNASGLASLHVARRQKSRLTYAGQVGTGFSRSGAARLLKRLSGERVVAPVIPIPEDRLVGTWVRPTMIVDIAYRDTSEDGLLRHAAFKEVASALGASGEPASRRTSTSGNRRPLLIIDGDSFAHRAYHALPKSIRRHGDRGGNAIVGFANYLIRFYQDEAPRTVLVCWDTLSHRNWRQRLLPSYQEGRVFDAELLDQLRVLPEFVTACGFGNAKAAGFEADDFLAAAARREEARGGNVLVASGDRDAFQLASDRTTILFPEGAGRVTRIGPDEVRDRYGVEPHQVPDFIALRGDASDRIPGARGVGARTAASLLRQYRSVEEMIEAGRFASQADQLRLYRRIAEMDAAAPIPPLRSRKPTWSAAAKLARRWGLDALGNRLDALA